MSILYLFVPGMLLEKARKSDSFSLRDNLDLSSADLVSIILISLMVKSSCASKRIFLLQLVI